MFFGANTDRGNPRLLHPRTDLQKFLPVTGYTAKLFHQRFPVEDPPVIIRKGHTVHLPLVGHPGFHMREIPVEVVFLSKLGEGQNHPFFGEEIQPF